MTHQERAQLARFVKQPPEEREWFKYIRVVVDLSDRHTLLPGPTDGPRTYDDLPKQVKENLERFHPKSFSKKENHPKRLQSVEGRWPDYAIAIVDYARSQKRGAPLPENLLGPTNKSGMPPEVQVAIKKLEDQMKRIEKNDKGEAGEQAVKDLKKLAESESKWPDYPKTVMELAKHYKIDVVSWMLPGGPEQWSRFRTNRQPKKPNP